MEELKGSKTHPWVPLVSEEVAGGGGSVEDGGHRRPAPMGTALRWVLGEEKLPESCAGVRRSDW